MAITIEQLQDYPISVNLDEIYVRKPCACVEISARLDELSGKFEECCHNVSIALSDMSATLSDIYEKIEELSGKISDISSQISAEEKLPPTLFAYSTEDAEVTAMLNQAGAWNTEPFPGYISSADTELMVKLSSVMNFDFPTVAELENYVHAWDSETIKIGETNYCSYSQIPFEGLIVPDSELFTADPIVWDDERHFESQYQVSVDLSCLFKAKIVPIEPTFETNIPEEYFQQIKVVGLGPNNRIYFEPSYSFELRKDNKRYLGLRFEVRNLSPGDEWVNSFKANARGVLTEYPIYASELKLFHYSAVDDFCYELVLTANTAPNTDLWGRGSLVLPTIWSNS